MEDYKIYKSELILKNTKTDIAGFDLKDTKSVVKFAEETLKIETYPEEVVFLICVNPTTQCINYFELSRGTSLTSPIGIKELMRRVLLTNAHGFILVHNHPNGTALPTHQDIAVTKRIFDAAQLLQVEFHDHVIVGQDSYASIFEYVSKMGINPANLKESKGEK